MNILIIDSLAVGKGRQKFSRDFIGGGPKLIAGIIHQTLNVRFKIKIISAEEIIFSNTQIMKEYDLCLISAMTMDYISVRQLIDLWRKINYEKIIIVGGPISQDFELINKLDLDIIVLNEAEKKIVSIFKTSLIKTFNINEKVYEELVKINGIMFRYKNKIYNTNPSEFLTYDEFNQFTNPKFYLNYIMDYKNYKSARIYVECLRGCSNAYRTKFLLKNRKECIKTCNICKEGGIKAIYDCPQNIPPGCGFCSAISSFGFPKSRKIDLILSEISALLKLGARRIVLGGPDFLDYYREFLVKDKILSTPRIPPEPNYEKISSLINSLLEIPKIKEQKVQVFIENVKASLCTDKALEILSEIPNSIFSIGCETGSDKFSEELGRPFYPSETLEVIRKAISLGIRIHVYFIHSLPGEKAEYLKESISMIKRFFNIGVEKITIYKYKEFPGCPFYILQNKENSLQKKNKKLNQLRKKLIRTAINFNRVRKEEMLGQIYETILAEPNFFNKNDAIGYILKGGPKVLIKHAADKLGDTFFVQINKVLSDKLVEGSIIK